MIDSLQDVSCLTLLLKEMKTLYPLELRLEIISGCAISCSHGNSQIVQDKIKTISEVTEIYWIAKSKWVHQKLIAKN